MALNFPKRLAHFVLGNLFLPAALWGLSDYSVAKKQNSAICTCAETCCCATIIITSDTPELNIRHAPRLMPRIQDVRRKGLQFSLEKKEMLTCRKLNVGYISRIIFYLVHLAWDNCPRGCLKQSGPFHLEKGCVRGDMNE